MNKRRIDILIVFFLSLVPTCVKFVFYPLYPGSDDAFIHARIASNIVAGLGWGINAHEVVNISTAPLYTILLSLIAWLTPNYFLMAMIFSCICSAIAIVVTYLIVSRLTTHNTARVFATIVAAFNVHLWRWNGTLMETMLAVALTLVVFYQCIRSTENPTIPRIFWLGIIQAAAVLVRPELLLLPFSTILYFRLNNPRRLYMVIGTLASAMAIGLLPWITFSLLYFHSILPTTYYAKASGLHLLNPMVIKGAAVTLATSYLPVIVALLACLIFLPRLEVKQRSLLVRRVLPFHCFPP
jgi:hypothetical protein